MRQATQRVLLAGIIAQLVTILPAADPAAAAEVSHTSIDFAVWGVRVEDIPTGQASIISQIGASAVQLPEGTDYEALVPAVPDGDAVIAATDQNTILYRWRDYRGLNMTIRQGTQAWGYVHLTTKHHTDATIAKAGTVYPDPQLTVKQGETTLYFAPVNHVQCNWIGMSCKVVDKTTVKTVHADQNYTDREPRGVITSFCDDARYNPYCPRWVHDAAHAIKFPS